MRLSRAEAERIFREMDAHGAGYVLFDEFCAWCVTQEASFADEQSDSDDELSGHEAAHSNDELEVDEDAELYGATPERGAM